MNYPNNLNHSPHTIHPNWTQLEPSTPIGLNQNQIHQLEASFPHVITTTNEGWRKNVFGEGKKHAETEKNAVLSVKTEMVPMRKEQNVI